MYTSDRREDDGEHGPIYMAIERALWALGPALLLFMMLGQLSTQASRQQAEADLAMQIASENLCVLQQLGNTRGKRRA